MYGAIILFLIGIIAVLLWQAGMLFHHEYERNLDLTPVENREKVMTVNPQQTIDNREFDYARF